MKIYNYIEAMNLTGMNKVRFINRVGTYVSNGARHTQELFEKVLNEIS